MNPAVLININSIVQFAAYNLIARSHLFTAVQSCRRLSTWARLFESWKTATTRARTSLAVNGRSVPFSHSVGMSCRLCLAPP